MYILKRESSHIIIQIKGLDSPWSAPVCINILAAKSFNWNFHSLEVVSR